MTAPAGIAMLATVAALLIVTGLPAWIILLAVALAAAVAGVAGGVFTWPILTAIPARLIGLLENDLLQALPLYVLMGALLHRLPLADTLFRVGRHALRGSAAAAPLAGLGIGALLAPMNGSVGASVAMLGRTLLPRLDAAEMPAEQSAALVCVASTLGVVIPPSLVLILLADAMMRAHTEALNATGASARIVNTQEIFVGALVPAAMLICLFAVVAWTTTRRRATPARRPERPSVGACITAAATCAFIGVLLLGVTFGYLYAVEAAATGAVVLALSGFATRALTARILHTVLRDAITITGALFALLVGATTFTLVVRAYETDRWVAAVLATLPGGAPAALFVVLAGLALCALVLDAFELIFVVVPVLMPALLMRVPDVTWVSVLALLILQLGFVTPPFGYAILMLRKHLARPLPTPRLARALAPYLVAQVAVVVLVLAYPPLVWHRSGSPSDAALPGAAPPTDDEARRMMERQLQRNDNDVREPAAAHEGR